MKNKEDFCFTPKTLDQPEKKLVRGELSLPLSLPALRTKELEDLSLASIQSLVQGTLTEGEG